MEERMIKLVSQLGLLALLVFVVAGLLGRRNQVRVKDQPSPQKQDPGSIVWNQSPVQGPSASAGLLFASMGGQRAE
jgi:hypothetical protein